LHLHKTQTTIKRYSLWLVIEEKRKEIRGKEYFCKWTPLSAAGTI